MATTRLMPLHTGKGRTVGQAISAIIDYTENPQKTDGGRLITSWQCDSRIADAEFLFAKNQYTQKTGRVRGEDDVIAYHLRQSFVPGEITPEDANRLGCELAKRFTKGNHAYIVCTHIDKAHIHNHVIWNSTALSQTRKFRNFWGSSRAVRRLNDTICIENGYSIVENPKRHGKSYNKWLGDKKKPSHRERICADIDDALAQKPDSFEALLELLRQAGYKVKGKKVPSLLGGKQKKSIRMDTLGDGYTPANLRAVIAGEKAHTPRKNAAAPVKPQKRSGNLLVDIQAKLRAGKGAGYARWATLFNLKQMAQTVAYLQENELLDYAILSEKATAASARFNDLSAKIKSAETRMAEIAVLRKHIVNYAKTRDTYVAYRKSADGRMEPDPEAAAVVQLIFSLSAGGMNATAITRELFRRSISTPGQYKAARGNHTHDISRCHGIWSTSTILRILEDERYTGVYVIGKRAVLEVGGTRSRLKDRESWYIIPNHHPAIVEKSVFDTMQASQLRFSQPNKKKRDYPLKGKAFCGCCGHALSRTMQKTSYYYCRHSEADEESRCHKMRLNAAELEQAVFLTLKKQMEAAAPLAPDGTLRVDASVPERTEYEQQIEALQDGKRALYERYLMGEIDLNTYKAEKAACDELLLKTKNAYAAVLAQAKQKQDEQARQDSRKEASKAIFDADALTTELAEMLIDRVLVYPDKRIEIAYKIQDIFD